VLELLFCTSVPFTKKRYWPNAGVAVNTTSVPEQIVVALALRLEAGKAFTTVVVETVLEQPWLLVAVTNTVSLFVGIYVKTLELPDCLIVPFTLQS